MGPGSGLEIKVNYSYPRSDEYEYITGIERINLDEEKKIDLKTGNGFIISSPKSIKKDVKDPNGIFSTKFGQKLGDLNPFMDRYSCQCGALKHRINNGIECEICHTKCKYVDDNFKMFGWIELKEHYVIHPDLYKSIEYLFGPSKVIPDKKNRTGKSSVLKNILYFNASISQDGKILGVLDRPANEPFFGIGMTEFHERFDEILQYYAAKNPKKSEYYFDIVADRDKVFIQSIPVFTTHLRPTDIQDENMFYEPMNAHYNMINILAHRVNKNRTKMDRDIKQKNQYLYQLQMKMMDLYLDVLEICKGKKGSFRSLVGGRCNFSSRAVIAQDPSLRIDQIRLPYTELVITLQQQIINILRRLYNISMAEAISVVTKSQAQKDKIVADIIDNIIHNTTPEGLPVLLNRNPTISYGSIMQMYCVGYTDDLTIRVPNQILPPMAADFDGDTLNVFHIINREFYLRACQIFNPRNAMYISRNDGMLNNAVMPQRDTLINANTMYRMSRPFYTEAQMANILRLKEKVTRNF